MQGLATMYAESLLPEPACPGGSPCAARLHRP